MTTEWILGLFAVFIVAFTVGFVKWTFAQFALQRTNNQRMAENARTALRELEEKLYRDNVHVNDCDSKQTLWGERFRNMLSRMDAHMVQNEKEHADIIVNMNNNAKAYAEHIAELSCKIDAMAECVAKLKVGGEC